MSFFIVFRNSTFSKSSDRWQQREMPSSEVGSMKQISADCYEKVSCDQMVSEFVYVSRSLKYHHVIKDKFEL